jgi:hypothetical protein
MSYPEYDALIKAFPMMSDQAVALACGALIDRGLERAIKARLRKLPVKYENELFAGRGPLVSNWAKIRFGLALGVYGIETYKELDRLREIRNAFAHAVHPVRFHTRRIAVECRALRLSEKYVRLFVGVWEGSFDIDSQKPRDRFIRSSLRLWFWLEQFDKCGGLSRPKKLPGAHQYMP